MGRDGYGVYVFGVGLGVLYIYIGGADTRKVSRTIPALLPSLKRVKEKKLYYFLVFVSFKRKFLFKKYITILPRLNLRTIIFIKIILIF